MIPTGASARLGALVGLITLGCLSSPGSQAGGSPGSVSGTIRFVAGSNEPGPLAIAVYGVFPPQGPPLRTTLVDNYELPYRFRFDGLAPGTYYVGALIDIDPTDRRVAGMLNAERDPHGYAGGGEPIVLTELQGIVDADIDLEAAP